MLSNSLNLFFSFLKKVLQCNFNRVDCHLNKRKFFLRLYAIVCIRVTSDFRMIIIFPAGAEPDAHIQFSSVSQSCPTLCDPMDCSMPGLSVHHQLPAFTQTHVYWVGDAIQPSHPLSSPLPAFSLFQHQGLFQWVSSLHQVAKVLEFQLQHQSFQWIFRTDFL